MNLEEAREKYPEFVYERFDWGIKSGDLTANFCFKMNEIEFAPRLTIHGVNEKRVEELGKAAVSNLVFNLGLAEIPSYWKTACAPKIVVKAGYLDSEQIVFWQDLIFNMGQFFYENKLPYIKPEFEVVFQGQKIPYEAADINIAGNRLLAPLGGGKDSLATLEMLRQSGAEILTFTLNANRDLEECVNIAGTDNIHVERTIDPKLLELNRRGYFNGHTPFSAILSVLGTALAALFRCKATVMSQERSSEEGNVEYLGKSVNHQYSKSIEFENKFRRYSKKYLAKNVDYFSFLRPLYEIQITKIFSRYPRYFDCFLSCNKPFTIAARAAGTRGWCGRCSKCLSVFVMLYPFVGVKTAVLIWGSDLFENQDLAPVMLDLCGQGACKPFECVGTAREMRAAFYLSWQKRVEPKPKLLDVFEKKIMPNYPKIGQESEEILFSWGDDRNLPASLAKLLKNEIGCG